MPGRVLAALKVGPATTELREMPLPEIPDDAALMKVEVGGVCGTEAMTDAMIAALPAVRRAAS